MTLLSRLKYEELKYNSTLGKFQKGDKFGSLSDFKNDPKLFVSTLDKLKNKKQEDNNTRNYVWGKVLKNRRLKKSDYEGLSSSEIIVAEATLLSIAILTSSLLLDRKRPILKSFTYLWGLSPPQNTALEISRL